MDYRPLTITPLYERHTASARADSWQVLSKRCHGITFYLEPLFRAFIRCDDDSSPEVQKIIEQWEQSAPRAYQRMESLGYEGDINNVIHFGSVSATGKTTVAFELLLRGRICLDGTVPLDDGDFDLPIAMTGHAFARTVAGHARDLDELMDKWICAETFLLDDLDKRGDSAGKFSPIVQQTLFDLIEARTTGGVTTIITLNSNGNQLRDKFDGDIGPYLLRRLRERFRAIDFDPEIVMDATQPQPVTTQTPHS